MGSGCGGFVDTDPPTSFSLGVHWVALWDLQNYSSDVLKVTTGLVATCSGNTSSACSTGPFSVAGAAPLPEFQGFGVSEFDIQLNDYIHVSRIALDVSNSTYSSPDAELNPLICGFEGLTPPPLLQPTASTCTVYLTAISIDSTNGYLEPDRRHCAPMGDGGIQCDPAVWSTAAPWFALDLYPKAHNPLIGFYTALEKFDISAANGVAGNVTHLRAGCPYTN